MSYHAYHYSRHLPLPLTPSPPHTHTHTCAPTAAQAVSEEERRNQEPQKDPESQGMGIASQQVESRLKGLEAACSSNAQALARIEASLHDLCNLMRPGKSGPAGEEGEMHSGARKRGGDNAVNESTMAMKQMAEEVADELKGRNRRRKSAADTSVPGADGQGVVSEAPVAVAGDVEGAESTDRRKRRQEKRKQHAI